MPALRPARAGEFTERASLNDKLDLAQAEAVSDLIDASTEAAARSATRSLSGGFSAQIKALEERLVRLRMLVEATLDFPEEELDFLQQADRKRAGADGGITDFDRIKKLGDTLPVCGDKGLLALVIRRVFFVEQNLQFLELT